MIEPNDAVETSTTSEAISLAKTIADENVSKGLGLAHKEESTSHNQRQTSLNDHQTEPPHEASKPSKNQQKKLKRRQEWEASREDRKIRRKEKTKARKERKRSMINHESSHCEQTYHANSAETGPANQQDGTANSVKDHRRGVQMPITFILDCQFDDLMLEHERTSLGGQITRCYSDNRKSPYRAHLAVSSFHGKLKDRFETVLSNSHKSWAGVRFFEEGFVEVAQMATAWMKGSESYSQTCKSTPDNQISNDLPSGCGDGEIVYLSSESPNTLVELKANSTYIIGGLVDHNRHKGICYKRAVDLKVKTAKLPIGDFLNLQSRAVLATNHVVEIMLKWLELRDWGQAFMEAIPKRKGIMLKEPA